MTNIAVLLRSEIVRLARKEIKSQSDGLKKASTQYRREIADLKRHITTLERSLARLAKGIAKDGGRAAASVGTGEEAGRAVRFAPKSLRSQRKRLGLTMADLGALISVSPQSVYNWERGATRPRPGQILKIAALRSASKREVHAQLEALGASSPKPAAKKAAGKVARKSAAKKAARKSAPKAAPKAASKSAPKSAPKEAPQEAVVEA